MREVKSFNQSIKCGYKQYCTKECSRKSGIISKNYFCTTCHKEIIRTPSSLKRCKNGNVFCSRSCAITYNNKYSGVKRNYVDGKRVYRKRALEFYGERCTICGYDIKRVLEVHHRDFNRSNNDLSNLDVLCPTHHTEYQVGIRKYSP